MGSPSPVPPYWRVVEAPACWNSSKTRASCSSFMPMPVSRMLNSSISSLVWIPAFAGMTSDEWREWIPAFVGMTFGGLWKSGEYSCRFAVFGLSYMFAAFASSSDDESFRIGLISKGEEP